MRLERNMKIDSNEIVKLAQMWQDEIDRFSKNGGISPSNYDAYKTLFRCRLQLLQLIRQPDFYKPMEQRQ